MFYGKRTNILIFFLLGNIIFTFNLHYVLKISYLCTEMIDVITLVQLKAFARQDGALLALVWIVSFACVVYMPQSAVGSLLALSTPFVVGWRLFAFRNQALDGEISFRRALGYCLYTFFYASLVFALAQFLYFRFLDDGTFMNMLTASVEQWHEISKQTGTDVSALDNSLTAIRTLKPIEFAFLMMMQNLFIGCLLSLPIAAIGKQSKPQNLKTS